jgi:hypothetical protein
MQILLFHKERHKKSFIIIVKDFFTGAADADHLIIATKDMKYRAGGIRTGCFGKAGFDFFL